MPPLPINSRRMPQLRILEPGTARTSIRREAFIQMGSEAARDHVCNYGPLLHKCKVRAILGFTVDRLEVLEPCRAPNLRRPSFIPCRNLPRGSAQSSYGMPPRARTRCPIPAYPGFPKADPPPPYTPRGYVFSLPQSGRLFRINDLRNNLVVPTSKREPFFGRFSVQF
jgi:hypothetical protein